MNVFYRSKHKHKKVYFPDEIVEIYIHKIKCRTVITNANKDFEKAFLKTIKKKIKKENREVANQKLGKVENLEILGYSKFFYSEFSILPYS